MTGNRETATHLLQHYFRLVAQNTGVKWDSDNNAEIESIVEALIAASVEQVTGTVLKSAMCPACGVRVAGASGLCTECTYMAEADAAMFSDTTGVCSACGKTATVSECGKCLQPVCVSCAVPYEDGVFCFACAEDLPSEKEHYAALRAQLRDATQEDGAYALRPDVSVEELDADTVGVLLWDKTAKKDYAYVNFCAAGDTITVYAAGGLSVNVERYEDYFRRPATDDTQETAQPVPVSAIAYLMADIAPADEYDTAKQQEARATVTAWLESLEAEED